MFGHISRHNKIHPGNLVDEYEYVDDDKGTTL